MLADIKQREPKDLTRINVRDELEVQWWSVRFSVTPQALRAAVEELGPSAEGVRDRGGRDEAYAPSSLRQLRGRE